MQAEFISPEDTRWQGVLGQVAHDFYHLPEYVRLAARQEGGVPVAFWAKQGEEECLIPFLRRDLPRYLDEVAGWTDLCSPYGYPSPLLAGPGEYSRAFWDTLVDMGRKSRILTAFLRFHPLFPFPYEHVKDLGELVCHGQTVTIDLNQSNEEIWRQTRKNHKSGINKLLREGFEATIDDWNLFDDFKRLYRETMQRVGAGNYYFFSDDYFDGLRKALGEKIRLVCVLAPTGEVATAGLFSSYQGLVQFHLAGTCEKYLDAAPTKLMFDFVRRLGKDEGARVFHLGGGIGGRADALYHFKAGFSRDRKDFFTFRLVLDPGEYAKLCRVLPVSHDAESPEDIFFPLYRKPQSWQDSAVATSG